MLVTMSDSKKSDLELLMENLRQDVDSIRRWTELVKAAKSNLMEKKNPTDAAERAQFQKCFQTLSFCGNVTTRKEMSERIQQVAVQAGNDSFYVDIAVDDFARVLSLIIAHDKYEEDCVELCDQLKENDWAGVSQSFRGLAAIYSIEGDRQNRTMAFKALQSLETTLKDVCYHHEHDVVSHILDGEVGLVKSRDGGSPLKLWFGITPCDLLDVGDQNLRDMKTALKEFSRNDVGDSFQVTIAKSELCLIKVTNHSDSGEMFLPAAYAIEFSKPFPITKDNLTRIEAITGRSATVVGCLAEHILQFLIHQHIPDWNAQQPLAVNLPDENHCYFLDSIVNSNGYFTHMAGLFCQQILFTDAAFVPKIVSVLRSQAVFNSVVLSCVRPQAKIDDDEQFTRLDISCSTTSKLEVLFEHPFAGGILSLKLQLGSAKDIKCIVTALTTEGCVCSDEFATDVFRRCWSIPVCVRAIRRKINESNPNGSGAISNGERDSPMDEDGFDGNHVGGSDADKSNQKNKNSQNSNNKSSDSNVANERYTKFDSANTGFALYAASSFSRIKQLSAEAKRNNVSVRSGSPLSILQLAQNNVEPKSTVLNKAREPRPNLLDLFKEIDDDYKELIPPRPMVSAQNTINMLMKTAQLQKPHFISQPPQLPQRAKTPVSGIDIGSSNEQPTLAAAINSPAVPAALYSLQKSPKMRHMSTASDTLGDLDTLCALSNSITAGDQGSECNSGFATPTVERAAPVAERKSSIQDAIESVVHTFGANSGSSGGHLASPTASKPPQNSILCQVPPTLQSSVVSNSVSNSVAAASVTATSTRPQSTPQQELCSPMTGEEREHILAHSRSLDYDILEHTDRSSASSGFDEFDFEKSDPLEAGLIDLPRGRSYSLQDGISAQPLPTNFYQNMQDIYSQGDSEMPYSLLRGMPGRGAPRRRRPRRSMAGSSSDRTVEASIKELKKMEKQQQNAALMRGMPANRRPRKRGAAAGGGQASNPPQLQPQTYGYADGGGSGASTPGMVSPTGVPIHHQQQQQFNQYYSQQSSVDYQQQQHCSGPDPEIVPPPPYMSPLHHPSLNAGHNTHTQGARRLSADQQYLQSMSSNSSVASIDELYRSASSFSSSESASSAGVNLYQSAPLHALSKLSASAGTGSAVAASGSTQSQGLEAEDLEEEASSKAAAERAAKPPMTRQQGGEETSFSSATLEGNIFENLQSGFSADQYMESVDGSASSAMLSLMRSKQMLSNNSKRKISIDTVIGKLMENANAVTTGSFDGDLNSFADDFSDIFEQPPSKLMRQDSASVDSDVFASQQQHQQSKTSAPFSGSSNSARPDQSATVSSGGSTEGGIKLVIKRTDIKMPGSTSRPPSAGNKAPQLKQQRSLAEAPKRTLDGQMKRPQTLVPCSETASALPNHAKLITAALQGTAGDKIAKMLKEKERLQQENATGRSIAQPPSKFQALKEKIKEKRSKNKAADSKISHQSKSEKGPKLPKTPSLTAISEVKKSPMGQLQTPELKKSLSLTEKPPLKAVTPTSELPPQSSVPGIFPGGEGIIFGKPLKGFKIPKIDDNTSKTQPPQLEAQPTSKKLEESSPCSESAAKKPLLQFADKAAKPMPLLVPPKPLVPALKSPTSSVQQKSTPLKQLAQQLQRPVSTEIITVGISANSVSPRSTERFQRPPKAGGGTSPMFVPVRQDLAGSFMPLAQLRPPARRTLLPDPSQQQQQPSSESTKTMPSSAAPSKLPSNAFQATLSLANSSSESSQQKLSSLLPSEPLRSPDEHMLVIDDTIKSPVSGFGGGSAASQQGDKTTIVGTGSTDSPSPAGGFSGMTIVTEDSSNEGQNMGNKTQLRCDDNVFAGLQLQTQQAQQAFSVAQQRVQTNTPFTRLDDDDLMDEALGLG